MIDLNAVCLAIVDLFRGMFSEEMFYATEVTISPLRNIIKPGTIISPGGAIGPAVDLATGIKYEINSLVP